MMALMTDIASRQRIVEAIRAEMARQDLRQVDLAERIDKPTIWVSRRLSLRTQYRVTLDLDDLDLIAKALGIDLRDLWRESA